MATQARLKDPLEISDAAAPRLAPQESFSSLAMLADLHAEAVVTTQLGKLFPRSLATAASLACLTGLVMANGMHDLSAALAWALIVMLGAVAILCCYSKAIASPVEQESLEKYARALLPIALYCGAAWGLGAFLVLPTDAGLGSVVLFVGAPSLAVALTLRERELVLAFLLPLLALSSFAALLRPLPDATLAAALMLITGAAMVVPLLLVEHKRRAQRTLSNLPTFAS